MSLWTFRSCIPRERQANLLAWFSFENVVGALMFEATVDAFVWETFNGPKLRGCRRADFRLRVSSSIYDAFFNSPVGYRAQFALDPHRGRKANAELIACLKSKLLAYVGSRSDLDVVTKSIEGAGAKVWIDEDEVQSHYFDDSPEIDYAPWGKCPETTAGLRAPVGSGLVVFGGWLDRSGNEQLNPLKSGRAEEIHECGFS